MTISQNVQWTHTIEIDEISIVTMGKKTKLEMNVLFIIMLHTIRFHLGFFSMLYIYVYLQPVTYVFY